jgi:hypothetical protein
MNEVAVLFVLTVISFWGGYSTGRSDGKVEGRMAVRRYYEDRERAMKVNR